MNLPDLIKSRRTIRKYSDRKVPQDMVKEILEVARWAPSAHNLQPWKFVVIDNADIIGRIADLLDKKAEELFSGFNIVMRDTAKNLKEAKVLVAAYSNGIISKKFDKLGTPYSEIAKIYEIQSISNVIENMLLYSHNLGLGMAWYGMTLFCEKEINGILNQSGKLMTVLSLGYPDEKPAAGNRKDVSEITEIIR